MYLNTNIAAMNAQRNVYQTNLALDKTLERLSSGLRINSAADDASGLAIVEKMYAQRQGISTAIQNTQDGNALFKIAEGALNQVGKMLSRMEELTVRASNQTLTATDRATIKDEIDQLSGQIDTISKDTEYNTLKLLDGNLDIKATLSNTSGNRSSGNVKIIDTPGSINDATGLVLSITNIGAAATASAAGAAATGAFSAFSTIATNTNITVNGIEISISTSDTAETIVGKINSQNSRTGIVATMSKTTRFVSLVAGKIDADATNVAQPAAVTSAAGTAVGYLAVGSINTVTGKANTITLGGDGLAWSFIMNASFTAINTNINSGTNATANLGGIAMAVKSSEGGTVFEMQNEGSKAFGVKIGIDMYNGSGGGFILDNLSVATVASATIFASARLSSTADTATIDLNASSKLTLQTGANYGQNLAYTLKSVDSSSIGQGASSKFKSLADISVASSSDATLSLKVVQKAIKDVASARATMGAIINRLDYTDKTLQIQNENLASAESKIRDADISSEMTTFTKQQILMQAGTSMLAQANQKPQMILSLLK